MMDDNWGTEYKTEIINELNSLREQLAECQHNNDVLLRRVPDIANRMAYVVNDMVRASDILKDNGNVAFGQRIDGWIVDLNAILAPHLKAE
jgi:hypothetical protein